MNLYVIGLNYKTAPVQIREKFSIDKQEYESMLSGIKKLDGVTECALLSTCNRTEAHVFSESGMLDTARVEAFLCALKGMDIYHVKKYFYVYQEMNAVKHIISVASGMDSMILGEDQILGQFKKAYEISMQEGASRAVLNTLSRLAITSSKKIKTRNIVLGKASSVAGQAGRFLERLFGKKLAESRVLIIGSGEMGRLVSKELLQYGAAGIYMTKRDRGLTTGNGEFRPGIITVNYNDRYVYIDRSDIIIGATSSPHYTVTRDMLEENITDRNKKRVFMDLAVPRDFDEAICRAENVSLYNIDDLKNDVSFRNKQLDLVYTQEQINSCTVEFIRWFRRRNAFICHGGV